MERANQYLGNGAEDVFDRGQPSDDELALARERDHRLLEVLGTDLAHCSTRGGFNEYSRYRRTYRTAYSLCQCCKAGVGRRLDTWSDASGHAGEPLARKPHSGWHCTAIVSASALLSLTRHEQHEYGMLYCMFMRRMLHVVFSTCCMRSVVCRIAAQEMPS